MQPIVDVKNFTKNFYNKEGEVEVLKNINFSLNEGEINIKGNIGYMFQRDYLLE